MGLKMNCGKTEFLSTVLTILNIWVQSCRETDQMILILKTNNRGKKSYFLAQFHFVDQ